VGVVPVRFLRRVRSARGFGWYGALRHSELAGIRLQHLDIDNHGVAISLARTKASQDHTVWVPIARDPTS